MAYTKKTWTDGEVITKEDLNNIENGIETVDKSIPTNASKAKAGIVKQAATVASVTAEDAGTITETFNQTEVQKVATLADANKTTLNALIDALKTAGIVANS